MPRRGSRVRISSSAPFLFFGKFSRAEQSRAKQSKAEQSRAEQSKAKQSKAKQSKAKQSKAKQSKAKQSKAKQSKAKDRDCPLNVQRGQSLLIDRGKGNVDKVLREQHLADNFRFLGEMGIPGTRGGFPELSGWRKSGAWCPATKKQGIAGGEAPRYPSPCPD